MRLSRVLTAPLHDFLASPESAPAKADSIFVLAGREERKAFGISLWRQGFAPELILSVGRFEWRRFYDLGLPSDGGLRECVDRTPPVKRHFFVRLRAGSADCTLIREGRLGTLREGRALAEWLPQEGARSLMVVSSSIHLRRVALVFEHVFRGRRCDLSFVAASPCRPESLWLELFKYAGYRVLVPSS